MSNLEKFTEEEALMLVSLPFRTGVWMSEADDEEGGHDDEQEEDALEGIISQFAQRETGTAFTQEIARQVMDNREQWEQWSAQIFTVTDDGAKAVRIVEEKLGKNKAKNYRLMLLKIARQVAKAADEFDDFNPEEETSSGIGGLIRKVIGKRQKDESHQANISPAEQAALNELTEALKIED